MELVWEDHPVPEGPFFNRDIYDKYSLAPHIRDLWAFLQGPVENAKTKQKCDDGAAKASCSPSTEEAAEFKDNSCVSSQASCWDSCDSEDSCADKADESTEDFEDSKKSEAELKPITNDAAFPEPRMPYPCLSNISSKQQEAYLRFLMNKKKNVPPQVIARVKDEVMYFMSYLQDVASRCADDYNVISEVAMQYSESFFGSCLECIRTLPQFYQVHEMTSLTGGTFNPGLMLIFEKQLLAMGNVTITSHKIVPADAQLAWNYQSVSSENPPAKKAKDMHALLQFSQKTPEGVHVLLSKTCANCISERWLHITISDDGNAERLSACYEPHVCLTRDALVRLLDNHGPDFVEQWELPVWVKSNPVKGSSHEKTVYIDSPLLKTEMTVRERSHVYHEESLKWSITKNGRRNAFHLMTEFPVNEHNPSPESSLRNIVENSDLDFEVDPTDVETFGETPQCEKIRHEQDGCDTSSPLSNKTETLREHCVTVSSISQEEMSSSGKTNDPRSVPAQQVVSEPIQPETEQTGRDPALQSDEDATLIEDSDDEKLVIDDSVLSVNTGPKHSKPQTTTCSADPQVVPTSESTTVSSETSSPQKVTKARRQPKRAKESGDQLSEILRMQTAMFKSSNEMAKCSVKSPTPCLGPSVHTHSTSLVKPCVSSFLERNQNNDGEICVVPHQSSADTQEHKKLLSQVLQATTEDEQDYEAPVEGSLFYKLYSLQDLLLMVRSSVSLTHTRNVGSIQNQFVPVHVMPKLEYQMCYGVESLTISEVCQLWTETLLHSSTVSYIAHINAYTSKVALLRKLPDDWKQNISCGFKLSKSLNILHHLLKKLAGLEVGQYLITHKSGEPFVTILKPASGNVSRGAYNLHQAHGSVPQPPASGFVPWVPVDPAVVLPFHQQHGRVPCTFPPTPMTTRSISQRSERTPKGRGKNKKCKQKKHAAKQKACIKKLFPKSA